MPKELLDHTLIEVRRHRTRARKPVQGIADLDEPRGVKLSNAGKNRILFK
jgi:hypothetical protein